MEAAGAELFGNVDLAGIAQVEQIVAHPLDLVLGHAATRNVESGAGKVRRCNVAIDHGCVAIAAAKFLLHLHGADRGIHL